MRVSNIASPHRCRPNVEPKSPADFKPICEAVATYGTNGTQVGNEEGYLVGIADCSWNTAPITIKTGSKIGIVSYYNSRTLPGGHSQHEGVMGLGFVAILGNVQAVYDSFVVDETSTAPLLEHAGH